MELTYRFDNDEKKLDIARLEFLSPETIDVYTKEGDNVYVQDGDYVYINQLIKESTNGIKTYATISGDVEMKDSIIRIKNDHTDSTFVSEETVDNIDDIKKDEILNVCENLGIDYENKLVVTKLKNNSKILVVNAMDVEPYQFNNNYLFQDNVKALLDTINLISKRFNINAHLLLNKYDDNNVKSVKDIISNYPDINFKIVDEVFPFNTNQLVAKDLFKGYKFEDIMFMDTFALYKIYVALKDGLPVNDRYITIVFDDANKVDVVKVKYGANIGEMLRDCVKTELDGKDVYLNNFMRKVKCPNVEDLIVTDNIKTIFIFNHEDEKVSKCIKCGMCLDICPLGINPLAKHLDPNCIRCGLCNHVCPANINLINRDKEK